MIARCTFHVGNLFMGVPVDRVQEVMRDHPVTSVPLSARDVHGLLNLRGEIVTVLDLRATLGLPPRPEDSPSMHVVVRDRGEVVSFLVDRIGDVQTLPEASFEPPPETLDGPSRPYILGAYKLDDRLLLEFNIDRVLATP